MTRGVGPRKAAVGVTALVVALSGCLGTVQAAAMDHEDDAQGLACEWDPAAELVQIAGAEGANMGGFGIGYLGGWDRSGSDARDDYWKRAEDDGKVGDGRCEVWVYRFIAPNQRNAFVVVIDRDGDVLDTTEAERESDDRPIGAWAIDSDEAADIAKDANEGLRRGTGSEHYGMVLVLSRGSIVENPRWLVAGGGGDDSGGGGGMAVIDAVTGRVIESHGGSGPS